MTQDIATIPHTSANHEAWLAHATQPIPNIFKSSKIKSACYKALVDKNLPLFVETLAKPGAVALACQLAKQERYTGQWIDFMKSALNSGQPNFLDALVEAGGLLHLGPKTKDRLAYICSLTGATSLAWKFFDDISDPLALYLRDNFVGANKDPLTSNASVWSKTSSDILDPLSCSVLYGHPESTALLAEKIFTLFLAGDDRALVSLTRAFDIASECVESRGQLRFSQCKDAISPWLAKAQASADATLARQQDSSPTAQNPAPITSSAPSAGTLPGQAPSPPPGQEFLALILEEAKFLRAQSETLHEEVRALRGQVDRLNAFIASDSSAKPALGERFRNWRDGRSPETDRPAKTPGQDLPRR